MRAMEYSVASHQARQYTVVTPVYQGPLDLLLQLIERAELDITRLALAQVTDQYLAHIRQMQDVDAGEISAFLVIAARLIQIKSEALLPRPASREEGEEDPGEALIRQLMEYRRYKKVADWLGLQEASGLHTHLRLAPPPRVEAVLDLSHLSLADLAAAAREMLLNADPRPELRTVVTPSPVTIRQKISLIFNLLRTRGAATFRSLLQQARSRIEIVVTFFAMLELVKRHRILASQEQNFGEILLQPAENWDEDDEFELEFGE
jgi:segregation and condensation protein A